VLLVIMVEIAEIFAGRVFKLIEVSEVGAIKLTCVRCPP